MKLALLNGCTSVERPLGVAAIAFAERADGLLHRSLLGRVPAGKRGREGEKKGRRGEEEMKGEEEKKKR